MRWKIGHADPTVVDRHPWHHRCDGGRPAHRGRTRRPAARVGWHRDRAQRRIRSQVPRAEAAGLCEPALGLLVARSALVRSRHCEFEARVPRYRYGFFYDGHRAEVDCHALLEVLAQPFGESGGTALKSLLDSARGPSFRLWANNSPFESKDALKKRGYWWMRAVGAGRLKCGRSQALQDNLAWLGEAVYAGQERRG